jgi:protein-S-isoprenylcysteine O-methyltransferase Ste14
MSSTEQNHSTASRERKKVGMLVPPPILLLAIVVLGVVAHLLLFGSFSFSPIRSALGGGVVLLSILIIGACVREFKAANTPFRPVSPATAIVNSGLYRFSRNPMYVGMAGVLLGLAVIFGSYILGVGLLLFVFIVHFGVVLPEEHYLESLHGETYRHYKQSVHRWL